MNRILPLVLGALILIGGAFYLSQSNGNLPGVSIATAQEAGDATLAPDFALGDENAPVTIIEYSSFTCPHCARFHEETLQQLKDEYIEAGKLRFIQREVYFDRYGLWGGMIARCGGEMRYYGISDLLYRGQKDWIGTGDPQEVLANLRKVGRLAGLDDEQITACLEDQDMARGMVAAYQANAEADGINATPTLIINGEKHSNMPYDELKAIIDGLLAQ